MKPLCADCLYAPTLAVDLKFEVPVEANSGVRFCQRLGALQPAEFGDIWPLLTSTSRLLTSRARCAPETQ